MNLVMLPMWVLSGIFFSTERFPAVMQPFVQALPLTAVNNALRAVMIDDVTIQGHRIECDSFTPPAAAPPNAVGDTLIVDASGNDVRLGVR